ncbi:MAG: hypothetical protein ACRD6W_18030, partial [Nitrososphaerales archaeon]
MSSLRGALEQAFPDTFGGLYDSNGCSAFVISVVGGSASNTDAIRTFTNSYLANASPGDPTPPAISYAPASHPLSQLQALQAQINSDAPTWAAQGMAIAGAGIDDKSDTVDVFMAQSGNASDYQSAFQSKYGTDAIEVTQALSSGLTDRTSDTPPWNGGDQIVAQNGGFKYGCTSGFGSHAGSSLY